jgi:hypothetical protein
MGNKYFLYIYYQESELGLFRLYDYEKEILYYGNKQIKSLYYRINFNDFLKEIKDSNNSLIEISKESFLTFLYFNFFRLKNKSKLELYNLLGLEEYAI